MALHTTWCCVTVPTVSTVWLLVTHVHTMSHKRRYLTGAHEVGPFGEDGVHDLEQRMLPAKTTHAGPWIPAPPSARSSEQAPTCAEWGSLTPIPSPKRTPLPTCPHASVTQQTLGTRAEPKGGHAPGTLSKPALCPHSCGRGRHRAHLQTGGGGGAGEPQPAPRGVSEERRRPCAVARPDWTPALHAAADSRLPLP